MPKGLVLILAPRGRDSKVIASILEAAYLQTRVEDNLRDLVLNLDSASAAVITEEAILNENRTALARWIAEQPPWSDFPFILLTFRSPNGRLLGKIAELLGNVTVLERPLASASLKSAVSAAARGRTRQFEAAGYLERLTELTLTLEQKVERRTQELTESNVRLQAEMAARERTEAALRQSQKMEAIGLLTGGIAHDFNNLLMAVKGNLELLRERRLVDGRAGRYVGNALHAVQRGANLISQLLTFSRKQQLRPRSVDVNSLIGGIEELIAQAIGGGIRFEDRRQSDLWPASVDATQLELMILNLAINARDAMTQDGVLTIETSNLEQRPGELEELPHGAYVCVAIRDTGNGMSPEVLARAFEPFFTTKPPGRGTGLGLSQVYGFARQSGGTVRIESEQGKGTVVRIFLPRANNLSVNATNREDDRKEDTRRAL